jgi:hypothetical protein
MKTSQEKKQQELKLLSTFFTVDKQLEALEWLCDSIRQPDTGMGEEKGPVFETVKNKLIDYLKGDKFSERKAIRLLRRFYIEAADAFAAHTPSREVSSKEHLCYSIEEVRKSLFCYVPFHQRRILAEYIKTVLPEADNEYDIAEDNALLDILFGDIDRGQVIRDIIKFIRKMSTDVLRRLLSELESRRAEFGVPFFDNDSV